MIKFSRSPGSYNKKKAELSGSVGGDRRVDSSSLTDGGVPVLCPWARHFIHCLLLVQPRKTGPNITETIVDWDVDNQKTNKTMKTLHGQILDFDQTATDTSSGGP